jgi:hypothetical protein
MSSAHIISLDFALPIFCARKAWRRTTIPAPFLPVTGHTPSRFFTDFVGHDPALFLSDFIGQTPPPPVAAPAKGQREFMILYQPTPTKVVRVQNHLRYGTTNYYKEIKPRFTINVSESIVVVRFRVTNPKQIEPPTTE